MASVAVPSVVLTYEDMRRERMCAAAETVVDKSAAASIAAALVSIEDDAANSNRASSSRPPPWSEYDQVGGSIMVLRNEATSGMTDSSNVDSVSAQIAKHVQTSLRFQMGPFDALTPAFANPINWRWRQLEVENIESLRAGPGGKKGMVQCGNPQCRSMNTSTTSEQLRSADEGATVVHRCKVCNWMSKH